MSAALTIVEQLSNLKVNTSSPPQPHPMSGYCVVWTEMLMKRFLGDRCKALQNLVRLMQSHELLNAEFFHNFHFHGKFHETISLRNNTLM